MSFPRIALAKRVRPAATTIYLQVTSSLIFLLAFAPQRTGVYRYTEQWQHPELRPPRTHGGSTAVGIHPERPQTEHTPKVIVDLDVHLAPTARGTSNPVTVTTTRHRSLDPTSGHPISQTGRWHAKFTGIIPG